MKIVKINKDRNFGNGIFKVIGEDTNHYKLVQLEGQGTKEVITLYKFHCFEDMETKLKSASLQKETANKIGRK
jgi:hypothetical protein